MRHARAARLLHRERDAEVGHQCVPVLQQDVFGLDVAVDDALGVGMLQRVGDFTRDAQRVGNRQLSLAFEALAERLAAHERHHVVQQGVGFTGIEQRQDVRMLQPRRGADLGEEAFATEGRTKIGMQHLDGDIALVPQIMREVHGGHAAGAEFALDAVAVGEGGGKPSGDVAHRFTFARSSVSQCSAYTIDEVDVGSRIIRKR